MLSHQKAQSDQKKEWSWDGGNHLTQACVGYLGVVRARLLFLLDNNIEFVLPAEDYRLAGAAVGLTHYKWWVTASPQHCSQCLFQCNKGWENV